MPGSYHDGRALTRRAALARFALVAGGVASTRLLTAANAVAAPPAGLGTARHQVFAALVESYDRQPGSIVDSRGRDLARELESRYGAAASTWRTWVDVLLDALEVAPDDGSFIRLSIAQRRATLRSWFMASEPQDALMFQPRVGDENDPRDVRVSNLRMLAVMQEALAAIPPEELELDSVTGLPHYAPPAGQPRAITEGEPVGTTVRLCRQLRCDCYRLLVSFFTDVRDVRDEAFA
jgi:hypothetical protein